jgi:hypothetical protein
MAGALVVLLFFHLVMFARLAFRKPRWSRTATYR